jgi:hypothetical protein
MTVCYQELELLVANGHQAPGSKRSSNLHKMYQCRYTAKNSLWWAEMLPETCRFVIPVKLEFSASVGFIHKEFVTTHGHTILKLYEPFPVCYVWRKQTACSKILFKMFTSSCKSLPFVEIGLYCLLLGNTVIRLYPQQGEPISLSH